MDLLKELSRRHGILKFAAAWTAIGIFGYVRIPGFSNARDTLEALR
jgi:hypothetical protein